MNLEVVVGDDAEYQMELDSEARAQAQLERESALDGDRRSLLCWIDGELDEVWDWNPGTRIDDVFRSLHTSEGFGVTAFLGSDVPTDVQVGQDVDRFRADTPERATYEVVVVSHDDEVLLDGAASDFGDPSRSLRDRILGEMFERMLEVVQSEPQRDVFVFARAL